MVHKVINTAWHRVIIQSMLTIIIITLFLLPDIFAYELRYNLGNLQDIMFRQLLTVDLELA